MEIYRKHPRQPGRGHRFVRTCAVKMHMDISPEPFCVDFSGKMPSANLILRHPFCASLRSRNADGHVRRAILCGNLQGKCGRVASGHRLVRTFHDLGKASPLPFPLLKGWTRAWYHPLFRVRIQAKKMDPCTSFCSKRACAASCSGVPFGTWKSEMHFVVIYFGMRCVAP